MNNKGSVLFIIHDLYQEDNHFPLGIGYLAAVLKKQKVNVEVYCMDVFHYSNDDLSKMLKQNSYDLICVGFLAARFKETVIDLCKCINQNKKDAWLVLGGHGPSPIPEYVVDKTQADIIVIGEGEETLPELLKTKVDGGELEKVNGIAFQTNKQFIITERRKPIRNLDSIPFPEWSLFPIEEYIEGLKLFKCEPEDRCLSILTSRGCINKCNFCYRMERGIRFRSINNVIDEILLLNERYGVNYFLMSDELFVYPKQRIFEFGEKLKEHKLKIKFVCNARVDVFDQEVAICLKEIGCQFLNFGMESSDQNVLDKMKKNTTVEENIQAATIAKKVGIGTGLNFIWNNIGDNELSLKNNAALIKEYNTYDYIRTIRPVTPYPGCDLYYHAINKGLLSGPDDFFEKFKNSDLITVNFMDISNEKAYELLFEVNKDLIQDHFNHTNQDWDAADQLIESFRKLYFEGDNLFRGARHYNK